MPRYCYNCGNLTPGENPKFCQNCARTYDVRLCPRLHENPRVAQACRECGSRDLSTPQPKVPMSWRLLAILARLGIGLLLFYVSLSIAVALLRTPEFRQLLLLLGLLFSGLWWLYSKLPDWLQELIRTIWKWRNDER